MKIGRRVYFDKITGSIIIDTGDRQGSVLPTTVGQDILTYSALSERNRDTYDFIEFPFGAFAQDFAESDGYLVNPVTKELEFSYPDPNEPEAPPIYQKPLSVEVEELKQERAVTQMALAEAIEKQETDKITNQLALAELLETLTIKGVL